MPHLLTTFTGAFSKLAGGDVNAFGERIDLSFWKGAEIGFLDTFPDVWGAVSEAEFRDIYLGVHHPVYTQGGPRWCQFFDQDPAVRAEALSVAASAAQQATQLGARYILFHFPWPGADQPGLSELGWYFTTGLVTADFSEQESYEIGRRVFSHLAEVQEKESIKIILEIDGPNRHFYEGDLFTRLFTEFPDLSLCVDTGRLGLIAKTHGQDPMALAQRWLPWTRHLHLSTSWWDEQGRFENHIPTTAEHTADKWPHITPSADIARMVVEAQPKCTIVLEHDPRKVSAAHLEAAHAFARTIAPE